MKNISILSLAAMLLLVVSCHTENKAGSPDLRTFGMKGDVKEVFFSVFRLESSSAEEQGDPWIQQDELLLSFDEAGRVTRDDYQNYYEYDDKGQVVEGTSEQTRLTRDDQGRIVCYDNTGIDDTSDDFDIMDFRKISYTYDAQGRVATEEYNGWEWTNKYTYSYEGDNIWPASCTLESHDEGWNSEGTITYEYLAFDGKGNWTERIVTRRTKEYEEPWGDEEPEVEDYYLETRETREILYWEDGED